MEANELMIGDWVYVNNIATQVMQVNEDCEIWTHKDPFLPNENVEPIPLTEEILKANGIKFQKGFPWWQRADPFGNANKCEVHINSVTTVIVTFVHEFQHALRLCGLDDLADNFKIE